MNDSSSIEVSLKAHFEAVERLERDAYRFKDELSKSTIFYYLAMESTHDRGVLLVSRDVRDDSFGIRATRASLAKQRSSSMQKFMNAPPNRYGFDCLLLAPPDHHGYLSGRLDEERKSVDLCIPIHNCEFSGDESKDEFVEMRRYFVDTTMLNRSVTPKICVRFANSHTSGGTRGSCYVFMRYNVLLAEVDNLNGVANGYIDLKNFRNRAVRIESPAIDEYVLADPVVATRTFDKTELKRFISHFLAE